MPRIGFARCQFQLIYIRYIFAYLGPHPAPRLPRWGLLAEVGLPRDIVTIDVPCNWLQIMENSIDRLHFRMAARSLSPLRARAMRTGAARGSQSRDRIAAAHGYL